MPTPEEFEEFAEKFAFKRPEWMKHDWQWDRVQELEAMGGGKGFPQTYEAYQTWIDEQLGRAPPRGTVSTRRTSPRWCSNTKRHCRPR